MQVITARKRPVCNLILICTFSLVQFSCSSSKNSAVPCPDFSHSRNMKSRHAQLKNTYPDQQERYRSNSAWAKGRRFTIASIIIGAVDVIGMLIILAAIVTQYCPQVLVREP